MTKFQVMNDSTWTLITNKWQGKCVTRLAKITD
jgi:hypothetical protein